MYQAISAKSFGEFEIHLEQMQEQEQD